MLIESMLDEAMKTLSSIYTVNFNSNKTRQNRNYMIIAKDDVSHLQMIWSFLIMIHVFNVLVDQPPHLALKSPSHHIVLFSPDDIVHDQDDIS